MKELLEQARALAPEIVRWRRHIHENPEVGGDLPDTCAYVTDELKKMGYQPYPVGGGVVAMLDGDPDGKVILLRADMDALPLVEDTGEPFSSKRPGAMHACGHDTHTAMLLGAAKLLMDNRDKVHGRVKFMFQPGEEGYKGALHMVEAGLLEDPHVDAAFGMHSAPASDFETGTVIHTIGPANASADGFRITVHGRGSHGSRPEDGIDPINVLAHIVIALQAINSRERNQKEPLILTCGQISAGTAENIIPESGFITGTIRAFNQEVREQAKRRLVEISDLTARTFGASAEVEWYTEFAPTINDIPLTEELDGYTRELLGDDQVKIQPAQMGSEDFSEVMLRVPGTFFNLSLGSKAAGYTFGAHNPKVRHDEAGLPVGSAVYANIAIEWLAHNR